MAFELRKYTHPDFTEEKFVNAPDATLVEAPRDGIAPDNFHARRLRFVVLLLYTQTGKKSLP